MVQTRPGQPIRSTTSPSRLGAGAAAGSQNGAMYPDQLPSRAFATVSFAVDWAYLRDLNLLCHQVGGDLETVVRRALADYAQAVSVPAVDVVRIERRQRRRRRWALAVAASAGLVAGVVGSWLVGLLT